MKKLPTRDKVKPADTWDLSSLFESDAAWEKAFTKWEKQIPKYEAFKGKLSASAADLAKCLKFDSKFDRDGERLGHVLTRLGGADFALSASSRVGSRGATARRQRCARRLSSTPTGE